MKRILAVIIIFILGVSLCACSAKWTDENITKSTKIEITKYDSDNPNIQVIYTITDENAVNSFCNTFSDFKVKDTHIREVIAKSYYIRFLGNGGEIDHITVITGHNTLQDKHGDLYKITGEIDVEEYISEVIHTAPSEIIWDPDESYSVDLQDPAMNWTFGQEDEPPKFSWSLRKCFTKEIVIEIDLNQDTYMEMTVDGNVSSYILSADEWETIKANAPYVDGTQRVQWRIRIDPNYHSELEPYYTDWNYFSIADK
ncbi:MAG: hypothetical protein MJ102_06825 [Clostridia bacterium]|nr:hypothetical protein [Clostridia bacterium]